jgi:hypothetical protein
VGSRKFTVGLGLALGSMLAVGLGAVGCVAAHAASVTVTPATDSSHRARLARTRSNAGRILGMPTDCCMGCLAAIPRAA